MSHPSRVADLFGRCKIEAQRLRPLLPTYVHLLAAALFPIYVGAHASLSIPSSAAPPPKKEQRGRHGDGTDEEPEVVAGKIEGLTPKDAALFPLLAGLTLSSLYFIIKWMEDPSALNKILSYYFMQIGVVFGTKFLKDVFVIVRSICLPAQYEQGGHVWRVDRLKQRYEAVDMVSNPRQIYRTSPLPGQMQRLPIPKHVADHIWHIRALLYSKCSLNIHVHKLLTVKMPVDFLDALAINTALVVVGFFTFAYKPWYMSNLLGFAFCYGSTQYMSPTTFWTGTLLLGALFFYDIYFVFFTPMMVTVATKLDVPIKLLFPRPPSPAETEKGLPSMAMLGLGDIVIPGMMIALALRFDLYLHYLRKGKTVDGRLEKATYLPVTGGWGERFWVSRAAAGPDLRAKTFPKTYFKASLIGYSLGMIVTLLVMQVVEHAQPALLYLVPGVLVALWGTAASKGDLEKMWSYTEDKEVDKKKGPSKREKSKRSRTTVTESEKANISQQSGDAVKGAVADDPGARGAENRTTFHARELTPTSTTTEEDLKSTLAADQGSEVSSNSCSNSNVDTASSSLSEDETATKHRAGELPEDEQKCRHLVWFSIDFPPPISSTERTKSTEPEAGAQLLSISSSPSAENGDRQNRELKKPTDDTARQMDNEPPGKRRRMR